MTISTRNPEKITIIAGPKSWIEGASLAQLEKVADLPGVKHVYGMPGVHPGPGHPIDAVFEVVDRIFPHLVGADIGCGMGWWRLNNPPRSGYGEKILYAHTEQHQDHGLDPQSDAGHDYLIQHEHALHWARVNRAAIAGRLLQMIGIEGVFLHDVAHNFVQGVVSSVDLHDGITTPHITWVHRKGAIPNNKGGVIIPGSRGSHSYLVEPIPENTQKSGFSLSHGAGRKMSRRDARMKFNAQRDSIAKLRHTKFNSIVICSDREMLMEEAPEAYKDISRVVQDLVDHDLVRVVAMLKPVITYKIGEIHDDC